MSFNKNCVEKEYFTEHPTNASYKKKTKKMEK